MNKNKAIIAALLALVAALALSACGSRAEAAGAAPAESKAEGTVKPVPEATAPEPASKRVTFIELGSVNCVPCKAMQPIMDEIRKQYPDQVEVIFHDVWTAAGRPYGAQFGIRVIPTQVFLDAEGTEFFRHEGFLPLDQLKQVLANGGVKL